MSDDDFQGFHIFATLKYGSRASAHLSKIQTVPQLVWAGPSLKDLTDMPQNYKTEWLAQYKEDHPNTHDMGIRDAGDEWEQKMTRKCQKALVAANTNTCHDNTLQRETIKTPC